MSQVEEYTVNYGPSILFAARFPKEDAFQLNEAAERLGCAKTELIVAGTMAEVKRRMEMVEPEVVTEVTSQQQTHL